MKAEPILDAAVRRKIEELKVKGDFPYLQLAKPILDVLAGASLAASTVALLWIFLGSEFESRYKLYLFLAISISTLINYILLRALGEASQLLLNLKS